MLGKIQRRHLTLLQGTEIKDEPLDPSSCIVTEEIALKEEPIDTEGESNDALFLFDSDFRIKSEPDEDFEAIPCNKSRQGFHFKCDRCGLIYDTAQKLSNHRRSHTQAYTCKKCKKIFKVKNNFDQHQCRYPCPICQKSFVRRDNLNQHINYVHEKWDVTKLFTCDYCNKGFKYRKSLCCHMKQHMTEKPLNCNICGEGFSVTNTYKQHMLTHGGKVPCKICGKKLKPSALYYHTKQTHESIRNFGCNLCPSAFKTRGDLTAHLSCHEKKYICGICDRRFSKAYALRQHLVVHENPGSFFCVICNKNFTRKDSLEHHLNKFHGPTKILQKFDCNVCSYTASTQSDLNKHFDTEHVKTIKEEKWLPCDLCNEALPSAHELKFHHFKKHSNITKCSVCKVDFETKREVIKHMSVAHNMK